MGAGPSKPETQPTGVACRARVRRALIPLASSVVSAVGCADCGGSDRRDPSLPAVERVPLPGSALRGLSGLTRSPEGADPTFLAVAERRRHVVPIRVDGEEIVALTPRRVKGVAEGLDLEGLAFVDDETIVFATEADYARTAERLLFARYAESAREGSASDPNGDDIEVIRTLEFDYDAWGIVPVRNRGLEGICVAAGRVVTASEMVAEARGRRWSPLGVLHPTEEAWTPYRIFLSSDTGKLSGLSCRATADGIEVTAIERHFDVLRIVRFRLDGRGGDIDVRVLADLRPRFDETPPNFEGLESATPGVYFLITDNDWRGVRGPTEMIRWEAPGSPSHARRPDPE